MAVVYWRPAAVPVGQITTITYSAYTSGETYTLTINGRDVSFTASASTLANVVDGLIAAIAEAGLPEFNEFTATNASGLVLTANVAGYPFVITSSATGGITETITPTQAATGPEFFDNADNWSGGAVPSAADDIRFENSSGSLRYALVNTTNYASLTFDATYSGEVGLPPTNANGYPEYRERFLKLGDGTSAYSLTVGQGIGGQSSRIQLDLNAGTLNGAIYNTGQSQESYPLIIKNCDSTSVVDIFAGNVLITNSATTALATLRITPPTGSNQANVLVDRDVAAGAVTISGGTLEVRGSATSLVANGGATIAFNNASTCPTVTTTNGSRIFWGSSEGISTKLNVLSDGAIDFSQSADPKAIAACDIYAKGTILDPLGVVTWTSGIAIKGTTLANVQLDLGVSKTLTPS